MLHPLTPSPSHPLTPWPRDRYAVGARILARRLLGALFVREVEGELLAGRIVETEAYCGVKDKGSHTYGGRRTPRNEAMWGEAGCAYVYFTYGMHHCVNVVGAKPGVPEAVLVRAIEPVLGIETMRRLRETGLGKSVGDRLIGSGPGRLCQALALTRHHNGLDMTSSRELYIADDPAPPMGKRPRIVRGPRIGISYAQEWADAPLRFWIEGNPHVSGPRTKR